MPPITLRPCPTRRSSDLHDFASEEQIDYVVNLFQSVGEAWRLPEEDFSNFTALAGSSPAYAYLFIDSLARAGVKHGLPKNIATEMAAQAVLGSAEMILKSDENPWALIDQVSSPDRKSTRLNSSHVAISYAVF